mgnify:CR=1 FL=1|jgi:predicted dehydrogenase|tara:strand:+ start:6687 stop:7673 length:987 start_codon:yes stop_codon:yes gene_type:complete
MIKVGQIGVGYWGPNILRNLISSEDFELISIMDLSKERRDFVAKNFPNVSTTSNLEDILCNDEIDAVVISTPVKSHFELAVNCLSQGKHILVEKPLATSTKEINEMEKIASKNDLIVMTGHTFLFNDAVNFVKKYIENNDLGEIRYIYSKRLNLGRVRDDVDCLWNFAPHDLSIIQYWMNDANPISIKRFGNSYLQKEIDDVCFLNLKYPNGVIANVHVSWLDPLKVRQTIVVGSKKMILYDDLLKDKIHIHDKGIEPKAALNEQMHYDKKDFIYRSNNVEIPKINYTEPLSNEIKHFSDCIQGKSICRTGISHAKEIVRILQSAENV